jgi:hypothetical protein
VGSGDGQVDGGGGEVDARVDPLPPRPQNCIATRTIFSCSGSESRVTQTYGPVSPMYSCTWPAFDATATCASGCAVEGMMSWNGINTIIAVPPQVFCAEAIEARIGDTCANACRPTRAALAADGTVMSMTYLGCGSGWCQTVPAPTVIGYLEPCSAALVAQYGTTNASGLVAGGEVCLIAWDGGAGAARSGRTIQCLGDWFCPQGSLCDDEIVRLDGGSPVGVCKPGPRGTLTPAILAP